MADSDWLIRIATKKQPANPKGFLEDLQVALFDGSVAEGKVLISTSEAGGEVTFAIPDGFTPITLLRLVESAIKELEGKPKIRRLRVSFAKAVI
jgi:hypothetical protein